MTDTVIFNIVERFAMEAELPAAGDSTWFLDWVLRSPKSAGHHLTAGWLAMNSLKEIYRGEFDITTCWESFGGMGAQALMAERLFNLRKHVVGEYSPEAVDHLESALPHTADVRLMDAYTSHPVADLVILDFGDLTVWKTREGQEHRKLLDRVFANQPKAVLLTDIACRYLHLHRERYETLLGAGSCATYDLYLDALCRRIEILYGYGLHVGYYDRWSTVMVFVPLGKPTLSELRPTPESPVGLEIL